MKKSELTRQIILQKAFELIYSHGYQTTSIDQIIATTNVTKGAFYYHFKTKDEMGLAIINELMIPSFKKDFLQVLNTDENPLDIIYNSLYYMLMESDELKVEYGCPASNLTQEMAPWNIEFTKVLERLALQWEDAIINSVENAKRKGFINKNITGVEVAVFVMSGYWGVRNLGKIKNSKSIYVNFLKALKSYFNTLK